MKVICTLPDDQNKSFNSSAPFHVVNEASLRDIKERVLARHPDKTADDFKVDAAQFRPNVTFDTEKAFSEDEFVEARLG